VLVSGNRLTGPLPAAAFNSLEFLQEFSAADNKFTGPVPHELARCHQLVSISLLQNNLSGEIPGELFELPNLRTFYIAENENIGGPLPLNLYASQLRTFLAHGCAFTGDGSAIAESVAWMATLGYLDIFDVSGSPLENMDKGMAEWLKKHIPKKREDGSECRVWMSNTMVNY